MVVDDVGIVVEDFFGIYLVVWFVMVEFKVVDVLVFWCIGWNEVFVIVEVCYEVWVGVDDVVI